eukprot:COSAG02_NODE_1692_length_11293_cov_12.853940_2_plen_261_part_00
MALEHASRVRRDGGTIECGTYTNVQAGEAGREGDGGRGKGRRCALGFKLGAVRWLDGLRAFLLDVNKRALVKVVLVLCLLVLGYRVVVGGEILVVGLVVRGLVLARGVHDRVQVRQSGVHVVIGGLQRLRRGRHLGLGGREQLRAVRWLSLRHRSSTGVPRVSSMRAAPARHKTTGATGASARRVHSLSTFLSRDVHETDGAGAGECSRGLTTCGAAKAAPISAHAKREERSIVSFLGTNRTAASTGGALSEPQPLEEGG